MTLATNGSATGISSSSNTITVTLSTTGAGAVCIAIQSSNSASQPTVSSVSSNTLGTWTRRGIDQTYQGGIFSAFNVTSVFWSFSSGALTNETITVTLTNGSSNTAVAFGVGGFIGTAYQTPWDTNASLPKAATSSPTCSGISTTSANDMLIAFATSAQNGADPLTAPTNFTLVNHIGNGGGSAGSFTDISDFVVSSQQSSINVTWGGTTPSGWCSIVDAMADGSGGADVLQAQIWM